MIGLGCPVRKRAWILPRYLDALAKLEYDKKQMVLAFLVNDSTDSTLAILDSFYNVNIDSYADIIIREKNYGFVNCERELGRDTLKFEHFAKVRNDWVALFNGVLPTIQESPNFVFSVDSDVLVPTNVLTKLVNNNKDICSIPIHNSNTMGGYGRDITNLFKFNDVYENMVNYPQNTLFELDVTGSVYLIKQKVLNQVGYKPHPLGEDFGFCVSAKLSGFKVWCDSSMYGTHILQRE